jgi:hypothetical protein
MFGGIGTCPLCVGCFMIVLGLRVYLHIGQFVSKYAGLSQACVMCRFVAWFDMAGRVSLVSWAIISAQVGFTTTVPGRLTRFLRGIYHNSSWEDYTLSAWNLPQQ